MGEVFREPAFDAPLLGGDFVPFGMELAEPLPPAINMMKGPTPTFDNPAGDTNMFDAG